MTFRTGIDRRGDLDATGDLALGALALAWQRVAKDPAAGRDRRATAVAAMGACLQALSERDGSRAAELAALLTFRERGPGAAYDQLAAASAQYPDLHDAASAVAPDLLTSRHHAVEALRHGPATTAVEVLSQWMDQDPAGAMPSVMAGAAAAKERLRAALRPRTGTGAAQHERDLQDPSAQAEVTSALVHMAARSLDDAAQRGDRQPTAAGAALRRRADQLDDDIALLSHDAIATACAATREALIIERAMHATTLPSLPALLDDLANVPACATSLPLLAHELATKATSGWVIDERRLQLADQANRLAVAADVPGACTAWAVRLLRLSLHPLVATNEVASLRSRAEALAHQAASAGDLTAHDVLLRLAADDPMEHQRRFERAVAAGHERSVHALASDLTAEISEAAGLGRDTQLDLLLATADACLGHHSKGAVAGLHAVAADASHDQGRASSIARRAIALGIQAALQGEPLQPHLNFAASRPHAEHTVLYDALPQIVAKNPGAAAPAAAWCDDIADQLEAIPEELRGAALDPLAARQRATSLLASALEPGPATHPRDLAAIADHAARTGRDDLALRASQSLLDRPDAPEALGEDGLRDLLPILRKGGAAHEVDAAFLLLVQLKGAAALDEWAGALIAEGDLPIPAQLHAASPSASRAGMLGTRRARRTSATGRAPSPSTAQPDEGGTPGTGAAGSADRSPSPQAPRAQPKAGPRPQLPFFDG